MVKAGFRAWRDRDGAGRSWLPASPRAWWAGVEGRLKQGSFLRFPDARQQNKVNRSGQGPCRPPVSESPALVPVFLQKESNGRVCSGRIFPKLGRILPEPAPTLGHN